MERPKRRDPDILKAAATSIAAALTDMDSENFPEHDHNQIITELIDAMYAPSYDGYVLGRSLERAGWTIDFEIAEILNGTHDAIEAAYADAIEAWVSNNNIQPRLAIGSAVEIPGAMIRQADQVTMVVRSIHHKQAQYLLYSRQLGHLSDQDVAAYKPGVTGLLLDYEAVEAYIR